MGVGLWVFGYGSLVWRPDFEHVETRLALLEGFARRFWQGSTDHRGVPGAPGRVVTLLPEPEDHTWGVAYRLSPSDAETVLEELDHRERGGYQRLPVTLQLAPPGVARACPGVALEPGAAVVYLARPDNPNYLGPAPLGAIAAQVRCARGPSGPNHEYVTRLAAALRDLGVEDSHVFALEEALESA